MHKKIVCNKKSLTSPQLMALLKRVETALNMLPNEVVNRETRETSYDVAADVSKVVKMLEGK